jgi:hypothetical protein
MSESEQPSPVESSPAFVELHSVRDWHIAPLAVATIANVVTAVCAVLITIKIL